MWETNFIKINETFEWFDVIKSDSQKTWVDYSHNKEKMVNFPENLGG